MLRSMMLFMLFVIAASCGASVPKNDAGSDASTVGSDGVVSDTNPIDGPQGDVSPQDVVIAEGGQDTPSTDVAADAALPRPSATSAVPCLRDSDCNDGIPCTVDYCRSFPDGTHRCAYDADPSMCAAGETCDIRMGCQHGHVCATSADCMDMDPCTLGERCEGGSRVCIYTSVLDGDSDGYAPRACGGQDCLDSAAMIHPGATELCNGMDDNCDDMVDEGNARDLCGEGATCASGHCTIDTPIAYADLVRLCTLEFACVGSLARFGSTSTVNGCANIMGAKLPDTYLDAQIIELMTTSGTSTYVTETGANSTFVHETLMRAHTATTCAEYLGVSSEHWSRCQRSGISACSGNTLLGCVRTSPLRGQPYVTDCTMRGGCIGDSSDAACRNAATCSVSARDYYRCDGATIRVGCDETIACRPGTLCAVTTSEMTMGSTHTVQAHAACAPAAVRVPVRCTDGTITVSAMPRCPAESMLPCTTESACDGNRLSLCVNMQRFDLDCGTLAGGGTCMSGRCVAP